MRMKLTWGKNSLYFIAREKNGLKKAEPQTVNGLYGQPFRKETL
ncbi:hypothetical protein [Ureibacillus sp. FSL W8-0352]